MEKASCSKTELAISADRKILSQCAWDANEFFVLTRTAAVSYWHVYEANDPLKAKLLRENPSLVDLSRGDVPPFYVEVGEINGQPIIQGRSCYHIAHPNLCTPCNTDEQEDDQLAMIVASSSASSDASPTRARWLAQSSNL